MLEVKVKVDYDETETSLSIAIQSGITVILGEAGAFKSTLMKVIGGVKVIEEGTVTIDGESIEELLPKERNMLLVSEETMPVYKNVGKALMQPLVMRGVKRREAKLKAELAAHNFGLNLSDKVIDNKKKFFQARMSLRETRVTMFDEPYHFFGEDVSEMIKDRRSEYIIVTSSNGEDARRLIPNYLIVLRRGELLQSGTYDEVRRLPINKYVDLLVNM